MLKLIIKKIKCELFLMIFISIFFSMNVLKRKAIKKFLKKTKCIIEFLNQLESHFFQKKILKNKMKLNLHMPMDKLIN